jgi:hypothetical protein
MALTYDLSNTALPRDDNGRLIWSTATESIIFYTMAVGIGDLNEKNAPEFWARVSITERIHGYSPEIRLTAADIRQHIGLKTNVFGVETRARWLKRIASSTLDASAEDFDRSADTSETRPSMKPSAAEGARLYSPTAQAQAGTEASI